jgi:hypothetical protein
MLSCPWDFGPSHQLRVLPTGAKGAAFLQVHCCRSSRSQELICRRSQGLTSPLGCWASRASDLWRRLGDSGRLDEMNGCFSCSWPRVFSSNSQFRSCDEEDGLKFLNPRMEGFRSQEQESFCGTSAAPNGLNEINYFPMTHLRLFVYPFSFTKSGWILMLDGEMHTIISIPFFVDNPHV